MSADIAMRTLACGTILVTERMSAMRSAAVSWLLPCGYAFEPASMLGLSAMWSELLLRGAGSRNSREHADAVDRLGASRSAANGAFTMAISSSCLGSRLPDVLPLLVDVVRAPRFDADGFEPARDLCLQSIESLRDDPQERAVLAARRRHHASPLDRSSLGTEEGLRAITPEAVRERWHALALPKGSILAAAGAIDPDSLAFQLDTLLKGWSGTSTEPSLGTTPVRGYAHESDETNQVQIVVLHDAPVDTGADPITPMLERLAISVLSGGMSGRLFSEVREKRGLCYSVSAAYRPDKRYASVLAYVGTTPERAQESLTVLLAELERINTPEGRVSKDEFDRAVIGLKSGLVMSGESTAARAAALASDVRRLGRARSLEEIARVVDSITLDQLNAYLAKRKLGTLTIQTLGPKALNAP